ncbi:hypothetical protein [uncultured Tessaracoccus sp.]|uniref:pyroglutamyl-peptidase I family protein n=1 Tax=uncultured Tessaracoccus sp. TaxID=905023 RepID=UPI0025D006D8|nr:hypothetical protein [uncultured Tessaracoccus sp.]
MGTEQERTVLVTGFEPFGGDTENASMAALDALLASWDGGAHLVGERLPVEFDEAPLRRAVDRHRPDLVLCLGEAGRREAVTPERWGVNEMRARIPDNAGRQPDGEPITPDGPSRLETRVDVGAAAAAIRDAGWASAVSDDAGRYVCNFVTYVAHGLDVPALFVHVPALRSTGEAGVGAETDGEARAADGRAPRTPADLADALRALLHAVLAG